jgi:hypothetical protein
MRFEHPIENRARELADHFALEFTPHPLDAIGLMGHDTDRGLDHDSHIQMDLVMAAAADAYRQFAGPNNQLERPVAKEEVEALVLDFGWEDRHMSWAFGEQVAQIAYRYLNGEGEDYETFLKF